jgi:hypothetical protein
MSEGVEAVVTSNDEDWISEVGAGGDAEGEGAVGG